MEIIYKIDKDFLLTNISNDELEKFKKNYEVIEDFKITDKQRKSIYFGTSFTLEEGEVILGDETEYLKKKEDKNIQKIKKQKSIEILAVASITDQINLIAGILEELISDKAVKSDLQLKGLDKFNKIKNILNK